jgi:threonine aldolase
MQHPRSFASDNNAGVHPKIMSALQKVNSGQYVSYGDDPHTELILKKFKNIFGVQSETFFVFNGTAANVLGLQALTRSYNGIFCSEFAHIHVDECGAPEKYLGSKLIPLKTENGKITPEAIKNKLQGIGDQHHVQAKVLSIAQTTEVGTVYSLNELQNLSQACREHGLYFHIDGARLANACASLNLGLNEITGKIGCDVLSFGGTKNGLLAGEAVVIFNSKSSHDFKYIRKQGMQLASKMRFFSAQFDAILEDDLWLSNASHANEMTKLLCRFLKDIVEVEIVYPPQANAVFAKIPLNIIADLQKEFYFYVLDEKKGIVRWMTSFETTPEDINLFINALTRVLKKG